LLVRQIEAPDADHEPRVRTLRFGEHLSGTTVGRLSLQRIALRLSRNLFGICHITDNARWYASNQDLLIGQNAFVFALMVEGIPTGRSQAHDHYRARVKLIVSLLAVYYGDEQVSDPYSLEVGRFDLMLVDSHRNWHTECKYTVRQTSSKRKLANRCQ